MRISYFVSLVFFYSFLCCKQDRFWRLSVRGNNDDNIICMLYLLRFSCVRFFFLLASLNGNMPHQIFPVRLVIVRLIVVHIRFKSAWTGDPLCAIDMRCTRRTSVRSFNDSTTCVCVWVRRQTLKYRFHKGAHRTHNGIRFAQTLLDCLAEIGATRSFDLPFEFIIY